MSSPLSIKEIEFVVKTSYKENLESEGFTGEFFQTWRKKKKKSNFIQILPDNWRGRTLSKSFYEASTTLIPKSDTGPRREKYRPISLWI